MRQTKDSPENTQNPAYMIIREAMRNEGVTYADLAKRIGERKEKLSMAVRCSNGVGPRAIAIRRKIAKALMLDPKKVWDAIYLRERPPASKRGFRPVKPFSEATGAEWEAMSPRERIRSLLADQESDLTSLAKSMDINYRVLTNSLYRDTVSDDRKEAIAQYLGCRTSDIWNMSFIDHNSQNTKSLEAVLAANPTMTMFFGFGCLKRTFQHPNNTTSAQTGANG